MTSTITNPDTLLQQARPGDRLTYCGIRWDVKDYSTYADPNGYQTAEWLLKSPQGAEYYLMREVDPDNAEAIVHWYLAEEINAPKIYLGESLTNAALGLSEKMRSRTAQPYEELRVFGQLYYFESQTEGSYEGEYGQTTRITWDYWDRPRQNNLAIEAWPDGDLHVYLSKVVNPAAFTAIEKGEIAAIKRNFKKLFALLQVLAACGLIIWGFLLMKG